MKKHHLDKEALAKLCYQLSWILNVLHVGFGFPKVESQDGGSTLQPKEKIAGQKFSRTLSRALLYANDEYVQAYSSNNILIPGDVALGRLG